MMAEVYDVMWQIDDGRNQQIVIQEFLPWKYKNYDMKDNAVELGIGFDDVKLLRNILIIIAVHSHIKFA